MEVPSQYLTLKSGETVYGIAIDKVREVVVYEKPSPMPNGSESMIGIISLRGSPVPVLDFRRKFGLSPTVPTVDTCIIILELIEDGRPVLVGITADTVHEVAEFGDDDMESSPRMASTGKTADWIRGMARIDNTFVVILDIDRTLAQDVILAGEQAEQLQMHGERAKRT